MCKQAALRSSCATLRQKPQPPPSLLLGLEPVQSCLGVARVLTEQKVPRSVQQRIVIKFLRENVPSAEIHHRLQQQYGEECLSQIRVFEWRKCFREGRERVRMNRMIVGCEHPSPSQTLIVQTRLFVRIGASLSGTWSNAVHQCW